MARISTPNNIKILNGERNKERFNPDGLDIEKLSSIPEPPMRINERATEFYNRYCTFLIANELLTNLDLMQICHLSSIDAYIETCFENDEMPAAAYLGLTKSISADFGLNVISREKIPARKEDKGLSKREQRKLQMSKSKEGKS